MNRIFRFLVLALVLVLVALISALTAMRIAIHGREAEVPSLLGLTCAEADSALLDRGLRLELERRFYSPGVPEGRIVSQSPAAGTVVRRGWRVRVAESLGGPRIKVPNVIGQSRRAAEINIRRRGLEVGTVALVHLPAMSSEQVIAMSPPPESMGSSPKVTLLLATEAGSQTLLMPNLIGKKLSEVDALTERSGLRLGKVRGVARPASNTVAGTVLKQWPLAGSRVSSGSAVSLEVAR